MWLFYRSLLCVACLSSLPRGYRVNFVSQAEDGIRPGHVTGVQTCALPISEPLVSRAPLRAHDLGRELLLARAARLPARQGPARAVAGPGGCADRRLARDRRGRGGTLPRRLSRCVTGREHRPAPAPPQAEADRARVARRRAAPRPRRDSDPRRAAWVGARPAAHPAPLRPAVRTAPPRWPSALEA